MMLRFSKRELQLVSLLREVQLLSGLQRHTLRLVGGWVRDKLLESRGVSSGVAAGSAADVDVSLDGLSGEAFCRRLQQHAPVLLAARALWPRSVGVIRSNPQQSKHLETATLRVLGFAVDFAPLRREAYPAADSRVPCVAGGSAREDALRRDFTINALSLNLERFPTVPSISTSSPKKKKKGEEEEEEEEEKRELLELDVSDALEDLTGRGLADLRAGVIASAAPSASAMLLDDPLRALRAVRFAARFDFAIDAALAAAIARAPLAAALTAKVSPERVAEEIAKMLTGPKPRRALALLAELALLPPALGADSETVRWDAIDRFLEHRHRRSRGPEEPLSLSEVEAMRLLGVAVVADRDAAAALAERLRGIPKTLTREIAAAAAAFAECPPPESPVAFARWAHAHRRLWPDVSAAKWGRKRIDGAPAAALAERAVATAGSGLKGEDLLEAGVPRGAAVGNAIAQSESLQLERILQGKSCLGKKELLLEILKI